MTTTLRARDAHGPERGRVPATEISPPETPYKGLSFYTERDSQFFFGRERETQVVAANLMASRLTLLYGESGVGKSSLLRAGIGRHFQELASENVQRSGTPRFVVVLFPEPPLSWSDDPIAGIALSIERAVQSFGLGVAPPPRTLPLCDLLAAWIELVGSDLLLVLDQFEEYLLYHEGEDGPGTLATELPRALSRPSLRASFLISIREDALAKLDLFKGRIPTLFDTYLRVSHLDRQGARDAIVKPIERFNELAGNHRPLTIEPPLVETLLDDLETGRVTLGSAGLGVSEAQMRANGVRRVETPYLQLVMTRLWNEEAKARSTRLRVETLRRLGGSRRIVETHLDETMRALPAHSRYVAAHVFRHVVTPSGMKIAHTAADLASYGGLAETEVEPVLQRLTAGDTRVLRRVGSSESDQTPARFEIFHDVLGAAILDWRARHRATGPPYIWRATAFHLLVGALIGVLCFLLFEGHNHYDALELVAAVFWAASAAQIWLITTVVFLSGWRKRDNWIVPLVGAVAAAIGPATTAVAALYHAPRLWSKGALPRPGVDLSRFSRLAALAGAAIFVAACIVPIASISWWLARFDKQAGRVLHTWPPSERTHESLFAHPWFALPPLLLAATVGVAVHLSKRASLGRFASALLAALALSGAGYFAGHALWSGAVEPATSRPSRAALEASYCHDYDPLSQISCSKRTRKWLAGAHSQSAGTSTEAGALWGGAGAALLLLVLVAPGSAIAVFATIIGMESPGGMVARGIERGVEAGIDDRRRRTASVLALGGTGLVVAGSLLPAGGWFRDSTASLVNTSAGAALQALVPAAAAAVVAGLILVRPPPPRLAAGLLAGLGLASSALFVAILGSALEKHGFGVPPGGYLGLAGGALTLLSAGVLLRGHGIAEPEPAHLAAET